MARGQEVLAGAGLHVDADAVDGHGPAGERIGVAGDAGLRLAQLGVRQFSLRVMWKVNWSNT